MNGRMILHLALFFQNTVKEIARHNKQDHSTVE
jgi:hypothetical protein